MFGQLKDRLMVAYHTRAAMKQVSATVKTNSEPVAIEITISWLPARAHHDQSIRAADQEEAIVKTQPPKESNPQPAIMDKGNAVNYGLQGEVRTIEFRSEYPLIIGGAPLCSAFTPIDLGRFVPNYAQVDIEISINGQAKSNASFIYASVAQTHVNVAIGSQGSMVFSY
jgi:hypothetical protein